MYVLKKQQNDIYTSLIMKKWGFRGMFKEHDVKVLHFRTNEILLLP